MMVLLESLAMMALELTAIILFFDIFEERREFPNRFAGYALFIGILLLDYYLINLLQLSFFPKVILLLLIGALTMCVFFRISVLKSLLLYAIVHTVFLLVDYLAVALMMKVFSMTYWQVTSHPNIIISMIRIAEKGMYILLAIWIGKIYFKQGDKKQRLISTKDWSKILVFLLLALMLIIGLTVNLDKFENPIQADGLLFLSTTLIGMAIVVFSLIYDLLKRERIMLEQKISQIQIRNQLKMYDALSQSYERQKRNAHEFKNKILCIRELSEQHEDERLKKYLHDILGKIEDEEEVFDTNHVVVNAIVNSKYREAKSKGIRFFFKFNDLSSLWLTDDDLIILLSNLINNAIESSEQCEHKEIKLKIQSGDDFVLSIQNTSPQKAMLSNGKYISSKQDKEEHGIGITNIIEVIEKYDGIFHIKNEEKQFLFSIIIPKP